jgi:hypothetical protein
MTPSPHPRSEKRDRFWFRSLLIAVCCFPLFQIAIPNQVSRAGRDIIANACLFIELLLLGWFGIFCFRLWFRNKRLALIGFAIIGLLLLLGFLPDFI